MTDLDDGAALRALMQRNLDDLYAPHHLGDTAAARGRQLRRRRTAGAVLGSAVTVAAVAALVVPAVNGSGPASEPAFATGSTVPASPSDVGTSANAGQGSPWWELSALKMSERLEGLVPAGVRLRDVQLELNDVAPGQSKEAMGNLRLNVVGASGTNGLQILMYPPESAAPLPEPVTRTDSAGNEHTRVWMDTPAHRSRITCSTGESPRRTCTELTDSAGQHVGAAESWNVEDITVLTVSVLQPDGGLLYVSTANSTDDKWGAQSSPSTEETVLSLEELTAIATDPVWTAGTPRG